MVARSRSPFQKSKTSRGDIWSLVEAERNAERALVYMAEPISREGDDGDEAEQKCLKPSLNQAMHPIMEGLVILSRKEKRKAIKKLKRKQMRKEMAVKWREEEEAKLNDPEEQRRIELMVREEADRIERERKEFEDRERALSEAVEKKRQDQERRKALVESQRQQEVRPYV